MTTYEFLTTLFAGTTGWIELRPTTAPRMWLEIGGDSERWRKWGPATVQQYVDSLYRDPKRLPYFGVAARREPTDGRYENCAMLPCLYADVDFKVHGADAVQAAIAALPYQPSLIVATGGGLHLYWLLNEPLTDMREAAKILDLWVRSIPVADQSVCDVARVLRLPGTRNFKYDPPRDCTVISENVGARYDAADLLIHAQQSAVARGESVPEAGVIAPPWLLPDRVEHGDRHATLYKFMRSLQSRYSLTWSEIWPLVQAVNKTRCVPPIGERDLVNYLRRGYNSADRAGFTRRSALLQDFGRDL